MLDILVLAAGSVLAFLVLPNEGLSGVQGFLAPLFLLPVYWFTIRRRPWVSALGGSLWMGLLTLLSQFWLLSFHPGALFVVLLFQLPTYALAFWVSSWLWRRFPVSGLWFQALWWTVFEFARMQGFFAYPYGSVASALWAFPVAFQSADLVGVSGITFLLAWTSAWLAAALARRPWGRLRLDLAAGLSLWACNLGYGAWKLNEPVSGALWRPALVQQSQDPWKGGPNAYEAGFDHLAALSLTALASNPDAIVWSETSFVPSVDYHKRYHTNPESLRLVRKLEAFLETQSIPYLIGNGHREKAFDGTTHDYNAVLAWDGGWKGRYEKVRLVPFVESFPFRDALPWVYDWLKNSDTHFWEPGRTKNTLTAGISVGTPVCYEDIFPDGARDFALAGARALVNLTNDSWAPGTASRMQHLSLAVFRSVETRLPLVRSGNDGATASISSRGELLGLLTIGPPGVLQAEVHLGSGELTMYTRWGDWLPFLFGFLLLAALVPRKRPVVDKGDEL